MGHDRGLEKTMVQISATSAGKVHVFLRARLLVFLACISALALSQNRPVARGQQKPAHGKKAAAKQKKPPVDLYGDALPEGAIARIGTGRLRHPALSVDRLMFSPNGKVLLSQ